MLWALPVGMQLFASNVTENSYALYDEDQMSPDIERAVSFLEKEGVTKLLSVKDAMGMVTNRSLLILVDHSKTALTFIKRIFMIYLPNHRHRPPQTGSGFSR